ncbi:class II fructose-bisphosphate aldolase [Ahrensia sp. R2A130]|uniref:class II fructose-bisphosphate aldolase n=1 Tax=Ahrensia sp. R2A130 TaxID=744979 RepID=UPI0001E0CA61|nr:class II fructose-bisphosphate aldolase [Ahrensia sp. R2A130]EFL87659.1 fructose-bisphosphate aldolase [Ahrensia sp. R2A130]
MPAVSITRMLADTNAAPLGERRAVAGVVVLGWEDARAYVDAAEEVGCPLILQAGPGARAHMPVNLIGPMMRHLADAASVPVAVHFDHGKALDECIAGLEHGFTSIMYDGSLLPVDENIATSCKIAEAARSANASFEGEVGVVGYTDGAASHGTSVEEVARYDAAVEPDALAISIGNVHLQQEKAATIDRELLTEIEARTTAPLVLHGGSGIANIDRRWLAANSRVAKFNIGTELRMAFGKSLRDGLAAEPDQFDRNRILQATMDPVKATAIDVLRGLWEPSA